MKRIRRGESSRLKEAEDVNQNSGEVPVRILRSHKRKLAEAGFNEEIRKNEKKTCKTNLVSDGSDCIIVDEVISTKIRDNRKVLTSTPLQNCRLKSPKFNASCIKSIEPVKQTSDLNEVIVISDSSRSVLPSVILSDNENSDNEIQVIPSTSQKEENKLQNDQQFLLDSVALNKDTGVQLSVLTNRNLSRRKKKWMKKHKLGRENHSNNKFRNKQGRSGSQGQIGKNIFVESSVAIRKTGLRPIIIDGSNVAFHHSNNKYFSCKGLEICIKYFKKRGHEVIGFVPHYRVRSDKSSDPKLLDQLVKNGDVILTPSRVIDGKPVVSYDDRFIVQTAAVKGGIIVTRDNYRDLLLENPAWAETIKYRLLQFTWVQDILMFPNDPLGPNGPSLEQFLKFN